MIEHDARHLMTDARALWAEAHRNIHAALNLGHYQMHHPDYAAAVAQMDAAQDMYEEARAAIVAQYPHSPHGRRDDGTPRDPNNHTDRLNAAIDADPGELGEWSA